MKMANGYTFAKIVSQGRSSLSSNPLPYIQSMAHTSVIVTERVKYKTKALNLVVDNLDLGREHKLFELRRTWLVCVRDKDGNVVKDSNREKIRREVFIQPDIALFEADEQTQKKNCEGEGKALPSLSRYGL